MGIIVIIILLFVSILFLPWMIKKVSSSLRLRKWQKVLINTIVTGIILVSVFYFGFMTQWVLSAFSFTPQSLTKNPAVAREYLDSIGINVEFPEFTVERHTFRHMGGDDTEDWWEIEFKDRLSESFLFKLDSLCRSDGARWRRISQYNVGSVEFGEIVPCYVFSCNHPNDFEQIETVTIFPKKKMAWLTHRKI